MLCLPHGLRASLENFIPRLRMRLDMPSDIQGSLGCQIGFLGPLEDVQINNSINMSKNI